MIRFDFSIQTARKRTPKLDNVVRSMGTDPDLIGLSPVQARVVGARAQENFRWLISKLMGLFKMD